MLKAFESVKHKNRFDWNQGTNYMYLKIQLENDIPIKANQVVKL